MNNMADCEGEFQFIKCNIKEECNIEKAEDKGPQPIEAAAVMETKIKEEMCEYNMDVKEDVGDFEIGQMGFVDVKIDTSKWFPLPEGEENSKSDTGKTLDIFKCDFCEEEIADEKDYRIHMGRCTKKNKSKLNQQEETKTNDKKFKCSYCDNAYEWKNCLTEHIRQVHSNHIYKCPITDCSYKTTQQRALRAHTLSKHNNGKKEHKCDQCSYATYKKSRVKEHIRNIHMNEKRFQCHYENCDYKVNWRSHFNKHIAVHHPLYTLHNGEGGNGHIFLKCPHCSCNYLSRHVLARHIKSKHSDQEKLECTDCPYKTTKKYHLKLHVLAMHSTEEKRYKCDQCSYATHRKSHLVEHVRTHTNDKPFRCHYENCDYKSNRKSHLRGHLTSQHTPEVNFIIDEPDETEFECTPPDNNYLSNAPLSQHSNQNHINNEKYAAKNSSCKATQQEALLVNTLANCSKEYKSYKCNTCTYVTHKRSHFEKHVSVHSNEKQFQCNFENCSYKAKQKCYLADHIRNHHTPRGQETQFRCSYSLCHNSYMSRDSLRRHIREKHIKKKPV